MPIILHKFREHVVHPDTEILILGTFNPDIPNGPTFFYGRPRNYLWKLLPGCWNLSSLKDKSLLEKQSFMSIHKVDFADLIHAVDVPADQTSNFLDTYIDSHVTVWKNITMLIDSLNRLNSVYFTRKTFIGIPNIHKQITSILNYCHQKNVRFGLLETPARYANLAKQQYWKELLIIQK